MSSTWGNNIHLTVFGESHGPAIGVTIDNLPPGLEVDMDYIQAEIKRRAPGRALTTPRKEADVPNIVSGVLNGFTTGAPLTAIIQNTNTRSSDYEKQQVVPRPSHADYTGYVRYKGFNDVRGGGHFSGRLTAPIVFAGALLRCALEKKGITIGSHIRRIYDVDDNRFNPMGESPELLNSLRKMDFPVLNEDALEPMKSAIAEASRAKDSVGGIIELIIQNLPVGVGDPMFDSIESVLSHIFFSVPAIKGVEFGSGFDISSMRGSIANDNFKISNGKVTNTTNNSGGINGGISNGMPIIASCAVKPTPSIAASQKSFNLETLEECDLEIKGRHDPCIVVRAVPVLEACCAIAVFDILMGDAKL